MSPEHELERYEATEAQELIRLLRGLRPPEREGRVPPHVDAKVLAALTEQLARGRRFARLRPLWRLVPVPALAAVLLLSLTLNAWLGYRAFTPHQVDEPPGATPGSRRKLEVPQGTLVPATDEWRPSPASVVSSEKAPALPLPDKPSIAVLPFVNMSGDAEQEYLSDGMTEGLIADLSKLSGLFVIARPSVFTYKGQAVKPEQVSRELGVRYVVEGRVRKAGNRVRVAAQLIDATTGYHRWAERYDWELQDIFALQAEIAQRIVGTLAVQLTAGEQARLGRKVTDNLAAYDYFLRGGEYLRRFTAAANAQARELFEQAIALDPGFALAYALLSVTYERAWGLQWSQDPQTLERAYTLAQQAVALDDALPAAHLVLGKAYWHKKQPDQAIAELERAIALDPNDASGYGTLAKVLNSVGKPEEALRLLGQAMRLNPQGDEYVHHLGGAYLLTGRVEESIAALKRVLIRTPDVLPTRLVLAAIYLALGWEEAAREEAAEILRINPHFSLEVVRQAVPYNDQAGLERLLDGLRQAGLK